MASDYDGEPVEVWPEHIRALEIFQRIRTQWRIGNEGKTGLDYAALYPLIDRATSSADEWDLLLTEIQQIEAGALTEMHTKD